MAREEQAHGEGDVEQGGTAQSVKEHFAAHCEAALEHRHDGERHADNEPGIDDDMRDRQAGLAHELVE